MEFRNLITFIKVAETRNFSKAAEQLGYSQSAVTMQIHQLENELGIRVFDRLGKTISLTNPGKQYLKYAKEMIFLEEKARQSVQSTPTMYGELKMEIAESLSICFLPTIIHHYRSQYPDVDLIIKTADPNVMFTDLQSGEIDMVYTLDKEFFRNDIICPRKLAEPIYFIAPASHPLAGKKTVTIQDLLAEPFILTDCGMSYRDELDKLLAQQGEKLRPFLEVGNTDVICQLVSQNVGLSFVPAYAARNYIEQGLITVLKVENLQIKMYRQLFYHKDKWLTPPMEAMMELLLEIDF